LNVECIRLSLPASGSFLHPAKRRGVDREATEFDEIAVLLFFQMSNAAYNASVIAARSWSGI